MKLPSLQTTCVIPVITTIGFTVIVTVKTDPLQFPGEFGVTRYVAVLGILELLPSVPNIPFTAVIWLAPPVMFNPVGAADQVYVVF